MTTVMYYVFYDFFTTASVRSNCFYEGVNCLHGCFQLSQCTMDVCSGESGMAIH